MTAQEQAFIPAPITIAGLTLRPLTVGSFLILKQTGNPLLEGNLETDKEFNVVAFLYIHAADEKIVRKRAANPADFKDAVYEFANGLSIADFAGAAAKIKEICEQSMVGMNYQVEGEDSGDSPNV